MSKKLRFRLDLATVLFVENFINRRWWDVACFPWKGFLICFEWEQSLANITCTEWGVDKKIRDLETLTKEPVFLGHSVWLSNLSISSLVSQRANPIGFIPSHSLTHPRAAKASRNRCQSPCSGDAKQSGVAALIRWIGKSMPRDLTTEEGVFFFFLPPYRSEQI